MLYLGFVLLFLRQALSLETSCNNGADGKGFLGLREGRFANEVCLITGSTSGVGEFTAYHLAQEGCAVVITGRREERGQKVLENVLKMTKSALDPPAIFVKTDISKASEVVAMVDTIRETYGRLDAVFANAGVSNPFAPMEALSDGAIDYVTDINVKGTFYTIRAAANLLKEAAPGKNNGGLDFNSDIGGTIVINSSILGISTWGAGNSLYGTSKHALEGMKKGAAVDLEPYNIRVNNVNMAGVKTEMTGSLFDIKSWYYYLSRSHPGRRGMIEPGEVASVVAFLLSEDSGYINSVSIPIDGGMTDRVMPSPMWSEGMAEGYKNILAMLEEAGIDKEEVGFYGDFDIEKYSRMAEEFDLEADACAAETAEATD